MSNFKRVFYSIFFIFLLISCDKSVIDSDTGMTRRDVKNVLNMGQKDSSPKMQIYNKSTPPNISKLLVVPPPPPMGNGELISFATTEEVPIKDILIELGRLADVDIEVDPEITGGIILKVSNKPLDVIVNRIAELGNLRYTYTNNILRFERDTPYTKTYNVDFLIENEVWTTIETALGDIINLSANQNDSAQPKIIINKPAGIITVYANYKTQNAVEKYIEHVKTNYAAQVLIEAKVVEVSLNDKYKMGIDWSFVNQGKGSLQKGPTFSSTSQDNANVLGGITGSITTAVFGGDLTAAINALDEFGLTKTLSSPRVHAMNNQKSELKFVNKLIYFSVEKEEEKDNDNNITNTTYTSTKQEEDVGVTLTITPSINIQKNQITLNVIPELKVKIGEVVDPVNDKNVVPIVQSKTVQTQLKVQSGNVLVIGGLMSEDSTSVDTGVPILSGIPIVGNLFKSTNKEKDITETVIFIKATIVKPNGDVNSYDREIYNFTGNKDNYM